MSREEVKQWKPKACGNFSEEEWTTIEDVTGFCPLQVSEYLNSDPNCSVEDSIEAVRTEIGKLWRETKEVEDENDIAANAISCLLSIPVNVGGRMYDKKYSVVSDGFLRPLFPAVLHAYRSFFWERLMDYVDKQESYLLAICASPSVTNDTRGRLFELIVISSFQKKNVVAEKTSEAVLPGMVDTDCVFETQQLPHPSQMGKNSLFIPKNSNFPAIDLILKEDKSVWAIQVHVSDHPDVAPKFKSMCEDQGWFKAFDNIFLVYLSPSPEVTAHLSCLPATLSRRKRQRLANESSPEIQVSALSVSDIECLKDLQWQPPLSEAMEVDD